MRRARPDAFPGRADLQRQGLEGWKAVGSAAWKVEDGALVGGQDGDPKKSGVIHTVAEYQDFELTLEFMIDEHGKYNSGIYLRNPAGKAGRMGYQVNIGRGEAGEYCAGVYTNKWLAKGDEKDAIRKKLDWNSLRILIKGSHIEVDLNGTRVSTVDDAEPDPKFLPKGVIALADVRSGRPRRLGQVPEHPPARDQGLISPAPRHGSGSGSRS